MATYKQCDKCKKLKTDKELHQVDIKPTGFLAGFAPADRPLQSWCNSCIEAKNK